MLSRTIRANALFCALMMAAAGAWSQDARGLRQAEPEETPEERTADGTWVDLEQEEAELDSLPRLGSGLYLEDGLDDEDLAARRLYLYGDSLMAPVIDDMFLPPPLDFEGRRLQDVLLERRLGEEENHSLVDIFRQDSLMAMSLMQLRGDEFPHYHLLSDLWVYIWRGRGHLMLDDEERPYAPGQFYQIPAGSFHSFHNISGAPTVALVWQRPPIVDSLMVEVIPEEILLQMQADSLRLQNLQERSIYRRR